MTPNEQYETELKKSAQLYENLYIDYGKQLEGLFKDKISFPPTDEITIWFRGFLKDEKSFCEHMMKRLKEELTYLRMGLNSPGSYLLKNRIKHGTETQTN